MHDLVLLETIDYVENCCFQTLVLEGAKVELNDTDGSWVGNGYTRCDNYSRCSL